ncbi:isochorismate synthase family protein [Thioflavicoccus mobilis 8321]|uniref:isochorismate synthase n=2 Tax=Thioflavicoccus mobilis TaxID=80679 RepID=L0GZ13_9GAMM|nr:isochorismate synthase [Thioflavicoccus mobilis]AGA91983.1 isochorismate synthase family protein [Thioflavicoccus mobilis 8321]
MLAPTETLEHLKGRLAEAIGLLPLRRPNGLASLVLELPRVPALAPVLPGPQFQFAHRDSNRLHAGYGVAAEWQAEGPSRLATLRGEAQILRSEWYQLDVDETGLQGFAMLGFAASPLSPTKQGAEELPNALLWVPEVALHGHRNQGALVLTTALPTSRDGLLNRWGAWLDRIVPAMTNPQPTPPRAPIALKRRGNQPEIAAWEQLVEAALAEIAEGRLEKTVVSRRLRLAADHPFQLDRLMATLGELFPSCQVVHLRREETSFVAATPERLLTQRGDEVEVDAIAGTVARAADPERDAELAEALRASSKDRHEHGLVIAAVREALSHCAEQIRVPTSPTIMQLRNAQHLWSRVRAKLHPDVDVFRLAELLHPTPATNGEPRAAASAWLRHAEPLERGWYTGAAGIVTPELTGELWVLLRCARLQEKTADLYAGAGIVAGSDPLCEWQETEDKLAAMLTALQFA